MKEIVIESALDTLKIFPFLFILYLLIEVLEHKTRMGKPSRLLTSKFAPVIGSATGIIPMCGFSVMASKLYERRYLTLGTLFAVFIATSDEALIVLALSEMQLADKALSILTLCLGKLVLGAVVGYLFDCFAKKFASEREIPAMHEVIAVHEHEEGEEHGEHACEHKHESVVNVFLLSPLIHALQIAGVILLCNVAFGLFIFWLGEENVSGFLQGVGFWAQPIIGSLIGLIPNCASSVVLAESYALGAITFGTLFGGLVTNAGLGVLVLFRHREHFKRNLYILLATFVIGVVAGYAVNFLGILLG